MSKYLTRSTRVAVTAALLSAVGLTSTAFAAETVVDRSEFSTTVKAGDAFKTRTYPEAVNFKNDDGKWSEIDRTLQAKSDGTVRPAAVDGDAVIPSNLSKPVVLEHDGRSVSFRLLGADASADRETAGTKATFDDALSGVDVSYRVRPNGLKELLKLQDKSATRAFAYDVRADSELTAAIEDGDLVFTDENDRERFRATAPVAWDSAEFAETTNALTLSVAKTGDRQWRLTMRADDKWLDDPARVYPVTLDPDYVYTPDYYWVDNNTQMRFHGATADCAMAGGSLAGSQRCALQVLQIGYGNNRPYKSIMKFDINRAIPAYAYATSARFLAWQNPNSTSKAPVSSRLRTVTRDWDDTATWDVAKTGATSATTTPWTTKGSDTSSDPNLTGPAITVGPSGYWSYWPAPVAAVNGWIKRTLPNYGFQISTEQTYPNVINAYEFTSTKGPQQSWPALEVTWTPDTQGPTDVIATGPGSPASKFLAGNQTNFMNISADDAYSGVARFELIEGTSNVLGTTPVADCTANGCPSEVEGSLQFSTAPLSEGAHAFKLRVTDAAGNATDSAPWTIYIDGSAPGTPTPGNVSYFDSDSSEAGIALGTSVDPVLADGSPGSGVATARVRYRIGAGSFGPWSDRTADDDIDLTNVNNGTQVIVESQMVDAAGNVSPLYAQTYTVAPQAPEPYPSEVGPGYATNSAARGIGVSFTLYKNCYFKIHAGLRNFYSERLQKSFEQTNHYADGNLTCDLEDKQYKQVKIQMCLEVNIQGWRPYNFRGKSQCAGRRWDNPDRAETLNEDISLEHLCYPGSHQIRANGRLTFTLPSGRKITRRGVGYLGDGTDESNVGCNEADAWRYEATKPSSPSEYLGKNLIRTKQYPPGPDSDESEKKGFEAHHIFPAFEQDRIDLPTLQQWAYACEIEPNLQENGVWLRGPTLKGPNEINPPSDKYRALPDSLGGKDRAYHRSIHTNVHFTYLKGQFSSFIGQNLVCDKIGFKNVLNSIKTRLKINNVPYASSGNGEFPEGTD